MDFTLSQEQLLIKNSAERFMARDTHAERWNAFAELGWLAIGAPDEAGGFGGAIETMILMEAFGRGLETEPYVAHSVFAGEILARGGRVDLLERLVEARERFCVAFEERGAQYDPAAVTTRATKDGTGYVLHGRKRRVLGAAAADSLIVSARAGDGEGVALFCIPRSSAGIELRSFTGEDGHQAAEVQLEGVKADASQLVGSPEGGLAVLEAGFDRALAALCAEAVGVMSVLHETTLDYLKQRTQFGVAIGSFQALQHRMAEMFTELELARSMAFVAAMTIETQSDPAARKRGVSAAKVQIARSGRFVAQNAIQLHGAIGMTQEYKVGQYFKRMTTLERLFGDADFHLARYIASGRPAARELSGAAG